VQGGGKPFQIPQGDKTSSEVRYQRSYDLLDNLTNYDSSNTLGIDTYLLVMDPMDHFHSLAAEDDLIDCFLYLPMSENIFLSYHMRQLHRRSLGTLSCSNCAKRSLISLYNDYWLQTQHCGAIKQPKINPGVYIYQRLCSHVPCNGITMH
jgi:hypothetical protein